MTAFVEVPQDAPAKSDFFVELRVDAGNPMRLRIDQENPVHSGENFFYVRRRAVQGIGAKFQTGKSPAFASQGGCSRLEAVVFKQEGVGQSPHNGESMLSLFFFLTLFMSELLGVTN